jgi:hypothetical protein
MAIDRNVRAACASFKDNPYCRTLAMWESMCDESRRLSPIQIKGERFFRYLNRANSKCSFAQFQAIQIKLAIVNLVFLPKTVVVKRKVLRDGKESIEERETTEASVVSNDPRLESILRRCHDALAAKGLVALVGVPRSPERMVRYLGELISVQNYGEETFVPKVFVEGELVELFVVARGRLGTAESAVSVQDGEGEWFYVPTPMHGSPKRHRSIQVIALVVDVLNSAVSKGDIPQIQTLTLSAP